jgi:thiosulfate reductase/polysulfide reductase chain A
LKEKGVLKKPESEIYRRPGKILKFKTPSGKIELASEKLRELGFDAVPQYTPPPENPPGYFRLLFGRAPMHTFGRTANNLFLGELMPENEIWINEISGRDMKLKHGEYIYLVNQDGVKSKTTIKVRLTQRIRPDAVYMVHGFGHTHPWLKQAGGRGASDADLVTQQSIDPIMGGTGMNNNFVTFTRKA